MTVKSADTFDLRKRAILVRMQTKLFGTQKKDTEATEKLAAIYNANADQVFGSKSILNRKNPLFKKIEKIKGVARNTFLAMTGPWQDDGFRIISTKRYPQLNQFIDEVTSQFGEAVDEMVKYFDDLKAEAKINLGDLYDESLYPSEDGLRRAFKITFETEVIPDRTSTVLDLDADRTKKIIADATAADNERTVTLTTHTHAVVRKELEEMLTALTEFGDAITGTKRTRTFRDNLIKGMANLADTLPGLNVTGDVKLDKLGQKIAAKLTTVDAAELRGSKVKGDKRSKETREADAAKAREKVTADTKDILDDLDGVFGDPD
jgi:hypothetical protein